MRAMRSPSCESIMARGSTRSSPGPKTRKSGQSLLVDQRSALPVIEVALLARQPRRRAFDEAALEKPAGGAGRQHEESRELELLRALLDLVQERFTVAFAPKVGMYGERGQLTRALPSEGVQRRAPDDRTVVLRHREAFDFHLQPLAGAPHEDAFRLERLDNRKDTADVIDRRAPQMRQRGARDHSAAAIAGE